MSDGRSNILSWTAIVISVAAFGVSAFQAWETRQHNHATVRPLIDFTYETDDREPNVGLVVANVGLGPAMITGLTIYVDRKPVKDWDTAADYAHLTKADLIRKLDLDRDDILKAGEIDLVFGRSTKNRQELNKFIEFVDERLAVSVRYCSVDDDCWSKCSSEGRC